MYTTVFYHVGLRLSTVFCTLMQAGVQSRKPKAAIFVLLTYMQIHLQSSEVIITFKSVNLNKELGPLYFGVWCSYTKFIQICINLVYQVTVGFPHGSRLRQSVNWNSNAVDSFNGYA